MSQYNVDGDRKYCDETDCDDGDCSDQAADGFPDDLSRHQPSHDRSRRVRMSKGRADERTE